MPRTLITGEAPQPRSPVAGAVPEPARRFSADLSVVETHAVTTSQPNDSNQATIRLCGDADLDSMAALNHIMATFTNTTATTITVDCAELTFIDCSALGQLLEWNALAHQHGIRLSFRQVPRAFQRLLEICDLTAALTISDSAARPCR